MKKILFLFLLVANSLNGQSIMPGVIQTSVGGTTTPPSTYFFDTYPSALRAYSLRQLGSSVTDIIEVQRSSDNATSFFTESEISGGALGTWVGAGNDGIVITWIDQSGNGLDITAGAGHEPLIVDNGSLVTTNGLPAIKFDGVNDYFSGNTDNTNIPNAAMLGVFEVESNGAFQYLAGYGRGFTNNQDARAAYSMQWIDFGSNPPRTYVKYHNVYEREPIAFPPSYNQSMMTNFHRKNLTSESSFNSNTSSYTALNFDIQDNSIEFSVGIDIDRGEQFPMKGKFQEVIFYDTDQYSNRAGMKANINGYYGIY